MTVKAKFYVNHHERTDYGTGKTFLVVHAFAVNGPGNEEWASASPSGHIQMTCANPAAVEQFKIGREFFVTFEHAPCVEDGCDQLSGHDSPHGKQG